VLADDDAFPEDIKSWCSSSNATLLEINRKDGAHRALILRSSQPPAQQSVAKASPAPAPFAREVSRPVEALRSTIPALPNQPSSSAIPALRVALRDLSPEAAAARLDAVVHAYEPGEQIALESNDPTFATVFMRWCAERNHTLLQLDTRANPARAELLMGAHSAALVTTTGAALVPAVATRKRCTLLILHSDFEALMAALLVANGAAAQGMEVTIFFSFWGLILLRGESMEAELAASKRGWFGNLIARLTGSRRPRSSTTRVTLPQRMFKMMMPSGPRAQALGKLNFAGMGSSMLQQIMRDQKIMSLPEMLSSAIEQDVRFMICTMSMGVMGITREDLMPLPNIVYGGVASFVEDAGRADVSLVF
jgi:peroxiredoxin family protein/TusA-related sulfurtransferase